MGQQEGTYSACVFRPVMVGIIVIMVVKVAQGCWFIMTIINWQYFYASSFFRLSFFILL